MMSKDRLAAKAAREAARLRVKLKIKSGESVCPFDIAEQLGVVVWFRALPTLEGMYSPEEPTVILGVGRPAGRRRHTCGHELGHHIFGHGQRWDQQIDEANGGWNQDEFIADRFSTALLMPKLAVLSAISRRNWSAPDITPEQAFLIAQDLGVGYTNLVGHLERTLRITPPSTARQLYRAGRNLPTIRNALAGFEIDHDLFVVDEHWGSRPMDIETGDVVLMPPHAKFEGSCTELIREPSPHLRAVEPGEGIVEIETKQTPIRLRVSRRGFTGLAQYRHMEDINDD